MTFTGPFEDRLALRELLETYADAVTQRDADTWGAIWAEDAIPARRIQWRVHRQNPTLSERSVG